MAKYYFVFMSLEVGVLAIGELLKGFGNRAESESVFANDESFDELLIEILVLIGLALLGAGLFIYETQKS